jgi:hypothetical protein
MQKIIDPGREAVIQYYCDGCSCQLFDKENYKEASLEVKGEFGNQLVGLIFHHTYCLNCGQKVVEAIQNILNIKINHGDNVKLPFEDFKDDQI